MKKVLNEGREFTRPLCARAGFTLIELLISTFIFSVIAAAIYATFAGGVLAWKKSTVEIGRYRQASWVLERMAKKLRNAVHYSPLNFIGGEDRISFPAILSDSSGEGGLKAIYRVGYSLQKGENNSNTLERSRAGQDKGFAEKEVKWQELLPGVKEINFKYSYTLKGTSAGRDKSEPVAWEKDWNFPGEIPRGVKIKLVLNGGQEKQATFEKTVFIAVGILGKEK